MRCSGRYKSIPTFLYAGRRYGGFKWGCIHKITHSLGFWFRNHWVDKRLLTVNKTDVYFLIVLLRKSRELVYAIQINRSVLLIMHLVVDILNLIVNNFKLLLQFSILLKEVLELKYFDFIFILSEMFFAKFLEKKFE